MAEMGWSKPANGYDIGSPLDIAYRRLGLSGPNSVRGRRDYRPKSHMLL